MKKRFHEKVVKISMMITKNSMLLIDENRVIIFLESKKSCRQGGGKMKDFEIHKQTDIPC